MNKNLDLITILKNCPKGTKLYSLIFGDVEFQGIALDGKSGAIRIKLNNGKCIYYTRYGVIGGLPYSEIAKCDLFPSNTQHNWSKFKAPVERFDPKKLEPYCKVLVRDRDDQEWRTNVFSNIRDERPRALCVAYAWGQCIPYNDDTKNLVGVKKDCPEFYKWWGK